MKKVILIILVLSVVLGTIGCGSENKAASDVSSPFVTVAEEKTTSETAAPEAGAQSDKGAEDAGRITDAAGEESPEVITPEQARDAIRNYCHSQNPDLEDLEKSGEYPIYWGVVSSNENEIVILYRSYTGALSHYYINPHTGDTFVTDFVPGITNVEEPTDEFFNVKDYTD
ncbi:MAG: hypothetical protein K5655_03415 [Lachnospiraceae bacterium]|nr:hypothetical protein [Lachnospiraceae bacterium]